MDEAGKNINWKPTVEAYARLSRELDRQVLAPLRRIGQSLMDTYGDREVEWHGATMPLRDALACLSDQSLHGEAFVMLDGDGRGHRVAPESIRVIR